MLTLLIFFINVSLMPASASALYFAGCGRRAVEYGGEQAGAAQEVGHSARSPFRKTGHRISAKHRGGTLRGVKPCGLRCQCGERNAWSLGLRGICFFMRRSMACVFSALRSAKRFAPLRSAAKLRTRQAKQKSPIADSCQGFFQVPGAAFVYSKSH